MCSLPNRHKHRNTDSVFNVPTCPPALPGGRAPLVLAGACASAPHNPASPPDLPPAQGHDFDAKNQLNLTLEESPVGSFPNPAPINSLPFSGSIAVSPVLGPVGSGALPAAVGSVRC